MKPALVVLAAGMGSRYGGVKQIDSVGLHGECLLDFSTFDAARCGFGKVIYIIRREIETDFRERLFDRIARNFSAEYVFQSADALLSEEERLSIQSVNRLKPWGTLHAILCAKDSIKEPFAVINADDYYGKKGFKIMGDYLSSINNDCSVHAMTGYVLKNTMSKHGAVTRGICELEGEYLKEIRETKGVEFKDGSIVCDSEGSPESKSGGNVLSGEECVSMNLFGFSPAALSTFEEYWQDFKSSRLKDSSAEALLPEAVTLIIKSGKGKVKVFQSEESWFGMTYPQDKQYVKDQIAEKISSGYYPPELWER